jgi:hypothetical protein
LYFLCLSKAQEALEKRWPKDAAGGPALPMLRTFALGATSRATAAIVFCPITVVKTRMARARAALALRAPLLAGLMRPRCAGVRSDERCRVSQHCARAGHHRAPGARAAALRRCRRRS